MDLAFIREYTPLYVEAAKLTIGIALFGILFSIVVGALCSIIRYYKVPVLQKIAGIYIELSRNTVAGTIVFPLFWPAENRNPFQLGKLCGHRTYVFGRQLYGRSLPKRAGSGG